MKMEKNGRKPIGMRNRLSDRGGAALVEVMAAFAMLMILFAALAVSLDLSGAMLAKSRSMRRQLELVRRACYLDGSDADCQEQDVVLEFVGRENGAVFSVDAVLETYSDGAVTLYEVVPGSEGEVELWNDLWEGQE